MTPKYFLQSILLGETQKTVQHSFKTANSDRESGF